MQSAQIDELSDVSNMTSDNMNWSECFRYCFELPEFFLFCRKNLTLNVMVR